MTFQTITHYRLIDLANNFEIEYQNMHRAEKDCQITKICFDKLKQMARTEAMQTIKNIGGENGDTITKKTNFLIVGNMDYTKRIKDGKSSKIKKAEKYKLDGLDIEVISEDTFYTLIENK